MHSASERYSTQVFCFSQEDISFKHGEYTFHHVLALAKTVTFTESYHDIERHCAVYEAPILIFYKEIKVDIH